MSEVEVSEEIKVALRNREGGVALESTIITHGMRYPENLETAIMVEQTIRANGSIFRATIAILNGVIKVVLSRE